LSPAADSLISSISDEVQIQSQNHSFITRDFVAEKLRLESALHSAC